MLAEKPKGQEVKTHDDFHCFTPTHFLLLIKCFFYFFYFLFLFFTKVTNGRTNQRGLSATLLLFFSFLLIFDFCFNFLENRL